MRKQLHLLAGLVLPSVVACLFSPDAAAQSSAKPDLAETANFDDPQEVLSGDRWLDVDTSVEKALDWLAGQQQPDGSFATLPTGQPGVTSLVVMAFMAQGEMPGEGPRGEQLKRAVEYVARCQKPNGLLSLIGPRDQIDTNSVFEQTNVPASYNHAIASLMLSEAYGMHEAREGAQSRRVIEAALALSIKVQQAPKRKIDVGGWRYFTRWDEADSDLSITSWYLMSLRSARNAGFDVPDDRIDEAMAYVLRCFDNQNKTFTYTLAPPDRPVTRAMAGAGILALAHGGRHESAEARAAGEWLIKNPFKAYNIQLGGKDSYHYGTFYSCQAMYQLGGKYWRAYYPIAVEQLLSGQGSDGSWSSDSYHSEAGYGQCYTTALSVLTLSVSNELLPIFQR